MTVTAEKLVNRDVYEVSYEGSSGEGVITARMVNTETGDESDYVGADDGKFIVTVATGYSGEADVSVEKDGEEIDAGTIVYGDGVDESGSDAPVANPDE